MNGRLLFRVTSHEQLSLAEFSGECARPKVFENGRKNVVGIWFNLVLKVKIWTNVYKIKYIKKQSYQNMSITKFVLLFSTFETLKKSERIG